MSGLVWAVKNGDMDQVKRLVEDQVRNETGCLCSQSFFIYKVVISVCDICLSDHNSKPLDRFASNLPPLYKFFVLQCIVGEIEIAGSV